MICRILSCLRWLETTGKRNISNAPILEGCEEHGMLFRKIIAAAEWTELRVIAAALYACVSWQ